MQPLTLTLKGFLGIRDGLGRDELTLDFETLAPGAELVAIVGANGRGKSTVMDNMHPYLTMPSRAAVAGPGGFSYHDHVYLPESQKDLTWSHEGRRYRSQVVLRTPGRRKTEAFLLVQDEQGAWRPARINDGTVSDGKVETYNRCVEAICGSADTFFTSVFSPQGKRQLSAYRNAEIKSLLADLLGQEAIRAQGQKAAETVRLLKTGLCSLRQQSDGFADERARWALEHQRLAGAAQRQNDSAAARQSAHAALEAARHQHAQLQVQQQRSRETEALRAQLHSESITAQRAGQQALAALQAQDQGEQLRLHRLQQRVDQRRTQQHQRWQALDLRRQRCLQVLAEAPTVWRAQRRLALAVAVLDAREARLAEGRAHHQRLLACQASIRMAEQRLGATLREAGQAALREQELALRFGLTSAVPCTGTDLQGKCQLLGDAREAATLLPDARATLARLAAQKSNVTAELSALRNQEALWLPVGQRLQHMEDANVRARNRRDQLAAQASKLGAITRAQADLEAVMRELAGMRPTGGPDVLAVETKEEEDERLQIDATRRALAQQMQRQSEQLQATQDRLQAALAALPAAYDVNLLTTASEVMERAAQAVAAADRDHLQAIREAEALAGLQSRAADLTIRETRLAARIATVETALSNWNLFARCMSPDGLIALTIDDAGPALSGLANDLLLACYGPRFTVSTHTLLESAKGDQKEGFDIVVHDGDTGDSKSVSLMSGGERVFVNECLIRAVALYLAQHSRRTYDTLFSDEADGALDPVRKRMFMAMKREVLRLGGYRREYFVSQTPELTAMADAVIDLDALVAEPVGLAHDTVVA